MAEIIHGDCMDVFSAIKNLQTRPWIIRDVQPQPCSIGDQTEIFNSLRKKLDSLTIL